MSDGAMTLSLHGGKGAVSTLWAGGYRLRAWLRRMDGLVVGSTA